MFQYFRIQQGTASRWVVLLIGLISLWNIFHLKNYQKKDFIRHDMLSYYGYLPAWFIHHDLSLEFSRHNDTLGRYAWSVEAENGRIFKMTGGVAILQAPFFLIAQRISEELLLPNDGFSPLYALFLQLGALFYFTWGLRLCAKLVARYTDRVTASWVVLLIAFGTNLYYYFIDESLMSHLYNFFLYAAFLWNVVLWLEEGKTRRTWVAGLCYGLLVLIRPTNALALLIPLIYQISLSKNQRGQLVRQIQPWIRFAFFAFLAVVPQLFYWKHLSGQWLFYSYSQEGFFWSKPMIGAALLGFRKGWLIYTPLMLLFIPGMWLMYRYVRQLFWPILLLFLAFIYVNFSWWCWWYGGSFGSRVMIDLYAILALPLGLFLQQLRKKTGAPAMIALAFACIYLNIFQIKQYRSSLLHYDGMNYDLYKKIWMTQKWPQNYDQLVRSPDYEASLQGERKP